MSPSTPELIRNWLIVLLMIAVILYIPYRYYIKSYNRGTLKTLYFSIGMLTWVIINFYLMILLPLVWWFLSPFIFGGLFYWYCAYGIKITGDGTPRL